MGKQGKQKDDAQEAEAKADEGGVLGYLIGAGLGLVLLFVLGRLLAQPPSGPIDELPHLVVLAEVDDLADGATRQALCDLQRELVKLELAVSGPLSRPVVLKTGAGLVAKDLDRLTPEELEAARPFFGIGGWIVPGLLSPDLKLAVLRASPRTRSDFLPRTRAALDDLLRQPRFAGLRARAYSHALGLDGDAELRARINLHFGVQTVVVNAVNTNQSPDGTYHRFIAAVHLAAAKEREHERVRSITSQGSFLHYAAAVGVGRVDVEAEALRSLDLGPLLDLAARANVPSLASADKKIQAIEFGTDAEGQANRDLGYDLVGNLLKPDEVSWSFTRLPR